MRLEREITSTVLAELSGVSAGNITEIELGRIVNPGVFTLYSIAVALGVRVEDLMGVPRVEKTTKGRSHARRQA